MIAGGKFQPKTDSYELTAEEAKLVSFVRNLKWGEFICKVKNGSPVMVSQAIRDVKLTDK